ncbi:hypothetical protein MPLB_300007 [Mesorhizobium sp. ORS 3324]|nr:hypothetical protein MPLB_300007 [Mesorhizobium sp. ORS 3324]
MDLDQRTHEFTTITVALHDRNDGGLRVRSDDLPGLILSGDNKEAVIGMIIPAITALLQHAGLRDFVVHQSRSVTEILGRENPQSVDMHIQQFVVELAAAA